MKALIKVGYGCNENCTFCHTLEVRHVNGTAADVHRKIDRARQLGHSMVVLSGGEPTLRPELFEWAEHVAKAGMGFGLVTNGLLLAYPHVLDRLLGSRLEYVYMSLHGGTPAVHNRVVRADTFQASMRALENVSGKGLDLTVNAVLVKQNLDDLIPLVDVVAPFTDATIKFSMLQPKGGGKALFDALTPKVSDVAARVRAAIAHGLSRGLPRTRFAHDGLPFCLLPGFEDRYDDLKTHRFATMVEVDEPDFFPVDDAANVQPAPCGGCSLRGACPGLYRGYHQAFGHSELQTVNGGARSNSFTYVLEGLVKAPSEGCALLRDGVTPWDRSRHLFIAHQGKVARYRTQTRDFTDLELERVKHVRGQVYFDASGKDAPDDFPRDLVPLTRSRLCTGCPERERCTGLFEPVFEDVFTRDDARVRALVSQLTGRVLDLGCGEGPYDALLGPRVQSGVVEYVGVDPSERAIAAAASRRQWGTHHVGSAEDLEAFSLGLFDHALVLRSWNHLRVPAAAVTALRRHLRPGGTLLVVDNEAFGLARSAPHAQRAERSSAAFEHFRNDGAEQAAPVLVAAGFEVVERRDCAPSSSNQWLLGLRAV
jgi:MoaA/NifB/PqqE/SkfB family radical SAM enzyme/SAM-dependent methyltransferase